MTGLLSGVAGCLVGVIENTLGRIGRGRRSVEQWSTLTVQLNILLVGWATFQGRCTNKSQAAVGMEVFLGL